MRKATIWCVGFFTVSCLLCSPIWWAWAIAKRHTYTSGGQTYEHVELQYNVVIWHANLIYAPLLDLHAKAFGYQETGFAGMCENSIQNYTRRMD